MMSSTAHRTLLRSLLLGILALGTLQGCAVVVVGCVAVAAGAIVAVNVVNEDTVRSELKDLPAENVYAAALKVFQQRGTVRSQNADGMRLEGEVGSDHVEITIVKLEHTVAMDVKARTMVDVVPATETAKNMTQSILQELGVTLAPEKPAEQAGDKPAGEKPPEKPADAAPPKN
jgi:hypothetical protein